MGVVKNGSVVCGCGVVNSKWWWLWIGLDSPGVVGLLFVWVDWIGFGLSLVSWSVDDFGFG